jgi:hypothetical protein
MHAFAKDFHRTAQPGRPADETGSKPWMKPFWGTHETERKQSGRKSAAREKAFLAPGGFK